MNSSLSPSRWLGRGLCILLFVSGCSTIPNIDSTRQTWQEHQVKAQEIVNWHIKGKLGFKSSNQGGSASIDWVQREKQYQISMSGPFASGRATIKGDERVAQMQRGKQYYSDAPQDLALKLTGLSLSVNDLVWWAKGIPSPHRPLIKNLKLTPNGVATEFEQDGWQLIFPRYQVTGQGNLPNKIIGQRGQQSFTLVISSWRFPSN